jgi:hypothetical protein
MRKCHWSKHYGCDCWTVRITMLQRMSWVHETILLVSCGDASQQQKLAHAQTYLWQCCRNWQTDMYCQLQC